MKSASQNVYQIDWSLPSELSWKTSFLLTCKILGLLVNSLAANDKYHILDRGNLTTRIRTQFSQKQKSFSEFFSAFLKSSWNFKNFHKKDDSHRFFIFETKDSKNVAWEMSEKSRFRGCLYKQYGKRVQALLNSSPQHLYHIHWSLARKLNWKRSLLLTCRILRLLVSTLATNDKCPNLNRDNLTIPLQMQFLRTTNNFLKFCCIF